MIHSSRTNLHCISVFAQQTSCCLKYHADLTARTPILFLSYCNTVVVGCVCVLLLCLQGVAAESDPEGFVARKLQQATLLPDPNAGYARAVRIIFTNIFDFFRANGEACCCWTETHGMHCSSRCSPQPTSCCAHLLCWVVAESPGGLVSSALSIRRRGPPPPRRQPASQLACPPATITGIRPQY